MSDKFFLDTNIFVYTFDKKSRKKSVRAKELIAAALEERQGIISFQVVQEFINVALKKFAVPLRPKDCVSYVTTVLEPLCEVFPTVTLYQQAIDIHSRWQLGFYDALIIASAIQGECTLLYTEDLQHEMAIRDVTIVNPFV